jgi:hypothetical protein
MGGFLAQCSAELIDYVGLIESLRQRNQPLPSIVIDQFSRSGFVPKRSV